MTGEVQTFTARTPDRLDKFLTRNCSGISRSQLQKQISGGQVTVNGVAITKAGHQLAPGDRIELSILPPAPSPLEAEALPLKIVYEDADILVLDKPAGLTVHPAPGHRAHTLLNAVLAHCPGVADIGSLRPGIVHRLDKDTSGLIVIAKNAAAQTDLMEQFRGRRVRKVYLALVQGQVLPEEGIIDAPLGRDSGDRTHMAITAHGRAARSRYKVVRYLRGYTLLEVTIETGRTHQIRVHLAAIGYPIVGDAAYGVKISGLVRQFLHAAHLAIDRPGGGPPVEFNSPLPEDLAAVLARLE
jgi:23S rRNA pseudouridine1911/1915/1917 synthase